MTRLTLVRHGQTDTNQQGLFTGRTDVPLNERGLKQVKCLHERLAPERFDRVLASDLKRTRTTAEAIVSGRGLAVEYTPYLREINFGQMEGLSVHNLAGKSIDFDWWVDGNFAKSPPGGESMNDVVARANVVLDMLKEPEGAKHILVVSHGAVLRVLFCLMLGMEPKYLRRFRLDVASVSVIEMLRHGAALALLNDTHHLDGLAG
jgi:broad specificity phosphatase PhoE